MIDWLLPILTFSTIFERFNVFLPKLGFTLKLSLILLPIVGLVLVLKRRLTFNPTFLFPFLLFLILVETLSVVTSFNAIESLHVVIFHLLMIGLFFLIVWNTREGRDLDRLVWAWGLGAAVVSFLGIWQFAQFNWAGHAALPFESWFQSAKTLPPTTFVQTFYGLLPGKVLEFLALTGPVLRPSSTFIDVTTAASFTGIFLVLGLGWFLSFRKTDLRRAAIAVPIIFSSLYFLIASSRSAALGLAVGMGTFSYLMLRNRLDSRELKRWLAVAAVVFLVGVLFFTFKDPERLGSALTRLEYARAAIAMFEHNPVLGVGAGNFEPYYKQVIQPGAPSGYSHSIFLTWIGELGLLGLVANLSIIAVTAFFLWRIIRSIPYYSSSYIRTSALLGAFIALVFANVFHAHYGLDFTWVLLGMCVAGYYLAKQQLAVSKKQLAVLGVRIDNVTMEEALEKVKEFFKNGKKSYVVTPNPEFIVAAQKDAEFKKILNNADLSIPDGVGLIWASRIWGTPLDEQVSGTDLVPALCEEAARRGGQVFLLGAAPGVAEKAAAELTRRYPKLKIAGTFAGDGTSAGDEETVSAINQAVKPSSRQVDLLFVAYGHGKQERWIKRNLAKIPVKIAVGVGGAFDYLAAVVPRAPSWLRRLGLEWLYRLVREPWRIKRQLALAKFTFLVFKESFKF